MQLVMSLENCSCSIIVDTCTSFFHNLINVRSIGKKLMKNPIFFVYVAVDMIEILDISLCGSSTFYVDNLQTLYTCYRSTVESLSADAY